MRRVVRDFGLIFLFILGSSVPAAFGQTQVQNTGEASPPSTPTPPAPPAASSAPATPPVPSDVTFKHQSEAGVVLTGGNTETRTVSVNHLTDVKFSGNVLGFRGRTLFGQNGNEVIGRNSLVGLRYERELNRRFSILAGQSVESDTFAGFDARYATDLGGKVNIFKKDETSYFFNETGYRYTFEDRVVGANPAIQRNHFIRVYFEAQWKLNESVTTKAWVEALPDLSDTDNFNLNFEPSITAVLTNVFSFKTSFLGKYDTQPAVAGNQEFDYTLTTSLVADY